MLDSKLDSRLKKDLAEVARELNGERSKLVRSVKVSARADKNEVKGVRKRLHVSQAVFAKGLGVGIRRIQTWEQGIRRPDRFATKIIRLMEEFRDPKELFEIISRVG